VRGVPEYSRANGVVPKLIKPRISPIRPRPPRKPSAIDTMTTLQLTFVGAPQPATARGAATKLYFHNDGDTIIYGNKTAVVARSLSDPSQKVTVYTEHRTKVTVAQFSPNGNYVASADESGKVRVWAYTHPENLLTKEISTCGRGVRDLAWDGEGKRIVAAGDGEMKAIAFNWDSGSELGQMTGMTAPGCAVAFKPTRPCVIFASRLSPRLQCIVLPSCAAAFLLALTPERPPHLHCSWTGGWRATTASWQTATTPVGHSSQH
jgi:WD40 repeat protein